MSRGRARTADASRTGPGELTLTSIVLFTLGRVRRGRGRGDRASRAVVAVGVFAFTLFVVGIVWPIVSLLAASTSSVVAPTDATVGEPLELRVRLHGPRRPRRACGSSTRPATWWRTASPGRRACSRTSPRRRGVFRSRPRSAAHVGAARRLRPHAHGARRRCPRRSSVAPAAERRAAAVLRPRARRARSRAASPSASSHGGGDTVRAVRPYVPGDAARLVHWPTSARRGELVVREHEPPPAVGVALVVDLRGRPTPRVAASRAAGHRHAQRSRPAASVWCCTCEDGGPVGELVADARDARSPPRARDAGRARPDAARRLAGRGGARVSDAIALASRGATRRRRGGSRPPCRLVAIPAAIALGAVGAIAAEHVATSRRSLGALAGAAAALLGVLALPSIPTRRATVVLLGLGGLGALRHASFAGADRSWLLVFGPRRRCVALVLVDRADAETVPPLAGGAPLREPVRETRACRVGRSRSWSRSRPSRSCPTVTDRLGRHVWPGLDPAIGDHAGRAVVAAIDRHARHDDAAAALRRGRVHGRRAARRLLAGRDVRRLGRHDVDAAPTHDAIASLAHDDGNTRRRSRPSRRHRRARTASEFRQTFHVESGVLRRRVRGAEPA